MNNKIKWIAGALAAVALIFGAYLLYDKLKENFMPDRLAGENSSSQQDGTAQTQAAPDFTVTDYDGNEVKLSDYFGKPIVMNFWASWCYYCTVEMPDFNEAYKTQKDVQFLMVNMTDGKKETVSVAKKYIENNGFDFPVFFDTKGLAANTYGASSLPVTFFIDKDGNLVTYANGMLDAKTLEKGINMIKK